MILFITPDGVGMVHNPHTFKSEEQCRKYIKAAVKKTGSGTGLCIHVIHGRDA